MLISASFRLETIMDKIASKSHLSVQVDVLLSVRETTGRQSLKPVAEYHGIDCCIKLQRQPAQLRATSCVLVSNS